MEGAGDGGGSGTWGAGLEPKAVAGSMEPGGSSKASLLLLLLGLVLSQEAHLGGRGVSSFQEAEELACPICSMLRPTSCPDPWACVSWLLLPPGDA